MNYLNIKLPASDDQTYSLSDFLGSKIILYFYPKDNTPGCTIESKDFTSLQNEFKEKGYKIIGVSKDSITSHKNFIVKRNLNILLLSDLTSELLKAFNVLKEKSLFGKKYMGIERSTFILNEEGIIIKEYRKVTAKNHAQDVLNDI